MENIILYYGCTAIICEDGSTKGFSADMTARNAVD
jgi:hypothetical protein